MRTRSPVAGALICTAVFVAGACGGSTGANEPTSTPPGTSAPAKTSLPRHGAPRVTDPLDVSLLKQDPCNAMTEQQAREFPGTLTETFVDSGDCVWEYDGERYPLGSISGGLDMDNREGLTQYYARVGDSGSNVNPTGPIGGYPAVIHDIGLQSAGGCVIKVGVRNDLVYTASAVLETGHPSRDTPCDAARKLAIVVIKNLKGAQ